jgi:hypothetical protein
MEKTRSVCSTFFVCSHFSAKIGCWKSNLEGKTVGKVRHSLFWRLSYTELLAWALSNRVTHVTPSILCKFFVKFRHAASSVWFLNGCVLTKMHSSHTETRSHKLNLKPQSSMPSHPPQNYLTLSGSLGHKLRIWNLPAARRRQQASLADFPIASSHFS